MGFWVVPIWEKFLFILEIFIYIWIDLFLFWLIHLECNEKMNCLQLKLFTNIIYSERKGKWIVSEIMRQPISWVRSLDPDIVKFCEKVCEHHVALENVRNIHSLCFSLSLSSTVHWCRWRDCLSKRRMDFLLFWPFSCLCSRRPCARLKILPNTP